MVDINKHRLNSSYKGLNSTKSSEFIRDSILNQAIVEFGLYKQYAPNSREFYINDDSGMSVFGVMIDVSDLEILTDTKWLLTSLDNKINNGDIITEKKSNRKWICIYDKDKTTQTCYKVKIQPCTYPIKIPYFDDAKNPQVYVADSIVSTYLADIKDFKQPFPTENGTTFISMQYNTFTSKLKRQDRLWYFDSYEIIGIDYTNVDKYINCGVIKFTLRPTMKKDDLDNYELGICDYYKYFTKPSGTAIIENGGLTYEISNKTPKPLEKISITLASSTNVGFEFVGATLGSTITNVTSNSCVFNAGTEIGIVYVKCYLINSPNTYTNIRIVIKN